jgi:hypothetical protein
MDVEYKHQLHSFDSVIWALFGGGSVAFLFLFCIV